MNSLSDPHKLPASASRDDVAMIGMSCIFPGAPDLQSYWQNIVSKISAITDPSDEWEAELFYDPDSQGDDRVYCKRGGYLKDLAQFKPLDYGVMPNSITGGEPDHFLALRVAHEALADAGYPDRDIDGRSVEVILGKGTYINPGHTNLIQHGFVIDQTLQILKQLHPEYTEEELKAIKKELKASLPPFNAEVVSALVPNIITGRIANRLNFMGTNYIVDAACASSMIAVERGIQDLLNRKCDLALVGGVHASMPPLILMIFCQLNALSRRGQIRPFDKNADGTLLGEGIGIVVLKRREDAERAGDRIYAVIKGIGTASDGRALGLLAPRVEGEVLALERAYQSSGISPRTIELIEAHGTGTPIGDVTEIQALSQVFGPRAGARPWCAVGSVKSMISHLIPAAGIAGLIKTALALHHKILPPTLNCDEPSDKLELEKTPFYINTETRPWIHAQDYPRRAGVNAFGFGGINAHVILEEYVKSDAEQADGLLHDWETELFILQAESRESLIKSGERLLSFVTGAPQLKLKDIAYSLNCPLQHQGLRLAIVADSSEDLQKKLVYSLRRLNDPGCSVIKDRSGIYFFEEPLSGDSTLAFMFPGEGSQYTNMLSDLCIHFPEVRACFDRADKNFISNNRQPLLSQVLYPPPPGAESLNDPLWQMDFAVSSVFAADTALFTLLNRLGIRPDALVGHSCGEFAALLASGTVAVADEEQLIRHGLHLQSIYESQADQIPAASLMAVGAGDHEALRSVVAESNGALQVSMDNCPHQVILCGQSEAINDALHRLQGQGSICNLLPFNRAYHTPQFQPVCEKFLPFFETLKLAPPQTTIYSCATAEPYPEDAAEVRRLAVNQWALPVRFRETIEAMYASGIRIFVEVGPKASLTGFVDDILRGRRYLAVPSNLPHRLGITQLNHLIGLLAAHGVLMRLDYLYARRSPNNISFDLADARIDGNGHGANSVKLASELPRLRLSRKRDADRPSGLPVYTPPAPAHSQAQPRQPLQAEGNHPRDDAEQFTSGNPASLTRTPYNGHRVEAPQPEGQSEGAGSLQFPSTQIMQEYLQTMGRFLETQETVVEAYLLKKGAAASQANQATNAGAYSSSNETRQRERIQTEGPFDISVSSLIPEKELVATCRLNLQDHLFLRDHTLGRSPSVLDETLTALPVVPLTVSLEIMAEAASRLTAGKRLIAFKNVRAHRWIEVEEKGRTLLIIARLENADPIADVEVKIIDADAVEVSGKDSIFIEGTVSFAEEYPSAPVIQAHAMNTEQDYPWHREQYYDFMFHGAAFRCVTSIDKFGQDFIEATLKVPLDARLLRSHSNSEFLTDPVLLDGAGQVVGFWAWANLEAGFTIFPIGFNAIYIYRPLHPLSEPVKCYTQIALLNNGRVRSEIVLADAGGEILARLEGWEDMRFFDWTRSFVRFALSPRTNMYSLSWPQAISRLSAGSAVQCCRLFESGAGIWFRLLASLILNRREQERWLRLDWSENRRRKWLLACLAAKDAARLVLKERYQLELCPADIEIDMGENGHPIVVSKLAQMRDARLYISVAHSEGSVAAIAGEFSDERGIGIDIEHMNKNQTGVTDAALPEQERHLLSAISSPDREEWLSRFACAKKALARALRLEMLEQAPGIIIQDADTRTGEVTLTLDPNMALGLPEYSDPFFTAQTGREGEVVFATSLV